MTFANRSVYRIIKSGTIDREGFISTFEEIHRGLIPPLKQMRKDDPGLYSTSCFSDIKDAERILRLMMRHHPRPIIARGETAKECGPSQRTKERVSTCEDSHVDWWIYDDSSPQGYFKERKDER